MTRIDGRKADQMRPVELAFGVLLHPLSSVLIKCGQTHIISAVSVEERVPGWMKAQKVPGGWLTCEYGMLPSSTGERMRRESTAGKVGGRTAEIQRLIGRSLRNAVELESLGEVTVYLDCDVINADGGTRCASITGASAALQIAMARYGDILGNAFREPVAAVSVGILDGVPILDLCYEEDSRAEVDMNVVMTASGKIIEIQGTAERAPFDRKQLNELVDLAESGLKELFAAQQQLVAQFAVPKSGEKLGSMANLLDNIEV